MLNKFCPRLKYWDKKSPKKLVLGTSNNYWDKKNPLLQQLLITSSNKIEFISPHLQRSCIWKLPPSFSHDFFSLCRPYFDSFDIKFSYNVTYILLFISHLSLTIRLRANPGSTFPLPHLFTLRSRRTWQSLSRDNHSALATPPPAPLPRCHHLPSALAAFTTTLLHCPTLIRLTIRPRRFHRPSGFLQHPASAAPHRLCSAAISPTSIANWRAALGLPLVSSSKSYTQTFHMCN